MPITQTGESSYVLKWIFEVMDLPKSLTHILSNTLYGHEGSPEMSHSVSSLTFAAHGMQQFQMIHGHLKNLSLFHFRGALTKWEEGTGFSVKTVFLSFFLRSSTQLF